MKCINPIEAFDQLSHFCRQCIEYLPLIGLPMKTTSTAATATVKATMRRMLKICVCCYQLAAAQVCLLHINISRNSHKNHNTQPVDWMTRWLNGWSNALKYCQLYRISKRFNSTRHKYMRTRDAINWKIIIAIKIRNKLIINSIRFNEINIEKGGKNEWKKNAAT